MGTSLVCGRRRVQRGSPLRHARPDRQYTCSRDDLSRPPTRGHDEAVPTANLPGVFEGFDGTCPVACRFLDVSAPEEQRHCNQGIVPAPISINERYKQPTREFVVSVEDRKTHT